MTEYSIAEVPAMTAELDNCDGTLDELFSNVKRGTREQFQRCGEVAAQFFLLSKKRGDGKRLLTQTAWLFSDDEEKAAKLEAIKAAINMKDDGGDYLIESYAFVAETWVGSDMTVRPSKDPDRREMVVVTAKERGRPDDLTTMAEIKRHALSSKPSLSEWENEIGDMSGGKVFNMFEDDDSAAKVRH
jgi:hypothetical protein